MGDSRNCEGTQPLVVPTKAVEAKVTVNTLPELDLESEGFPKVTITVTDKDHQLSLDKKGEQTLKLPADAAQFKIKSAVWRGFTLKPELNKSLDLTDGQIVIPFSPDRDFTKQLVLNEFFRIGRRHFQLNTDRELLEKLSLKELPEPREETTEFADCVIKVRNESGGTIVPTFVDCDDLVWGKKDLPERLTGPNLGNHMISTNTTVNENDPFLAKSMYNRTVAVLVAWQNKQGTQNRYYCLAGFVKLKPEKQDRDRVYHITIIDDAQKVSLKDNPPNDNMRVIR